MFRAILVLLSLSTALHAADDPLALIPSKSTVVIHLGGFEKSQDRLNAMLAKALPADAKKMGELLKTQLGQLLEGRDLKNLSKDGHVFLAAWDLEQISENPGLALFFPTDNADGFKQTFFTADERKTFEKDGQIEFFKMEGRDNPFYFVPKIEKGKGYVVAVSEKNLAIDYGTGKVPGLEKALSAETRKSFLESDFSVFVNIKEINTKYGDQIKTFKPFVEALLKQGEDMGIQGINKQQMEQFKVVLDGAFKVLEDGVGAVIALEFRPEGANLKLLAQFGEGSGTNAYLKGVKNSKFADLSQLPGEQSTYSAMALRLLSDSGTELAGGQALHDEDDKVNEKLLDLAKQIDKLTDGPATTSSQGVFGNGSFVVTPFKDPKKAIELQKSLYATLTPKTTVAQMPLKEAVTFKADVAKVKDLSLSHLKIAFDIEKAVAAMPEETREITKKTILKMVGEEINVWTTADAKNVITIQAKTADDAKALLSAYLDGKTAAKNESFQFTRKQLPAEGSMLVMIDAAKTAYGIFDMMKDTLGMLPLPVAIPDLKEPQNKPAYVGISLVLKPEHGIVDIFVPGTAVAQIKKLLEPILGKDD
jgi:hypothetical protein